MTRLFYYPYKFSCLSNRQRLLLCEAFFTLVFAKIAINLLPFKRLLKHLDRTTIKNECHGRERELQCKNVVWAVNCIANRLPLIFVCFPRGISVYFMLYRRGILTTFFYGVSNRETDKYSSHVWVMNGKSGLIGFEIAHNYVVLFTRPSHASRYNQLASHHKGGFYNGK